jgi:hypothetical protein
LYERHECIAIDIDDFAVIRRVVTTDQIEQEKQAKAQRQEVHEGIFQYLFHVNLDVLRWLPDQLRLNFLEEIRPNRSTDYGNPDKVARAPLNAFQLLFAFLLA